MSETTHDTRELFNPAQAVNEFAWLDMPDDKSARLHNAMLQCLLGITAAQPPSGYVARSDDGRKGELCVVLDNSSEGMSGMQQVILHLTRQTNREGARTMHATSATFVDTETQRITRIRISADAYNRATIQSHQLADSTDKILYAMRLEKVESGTYDPDLVPRETDLEGVAAETAFDETTRILETGRVNTTLTTRYAANANVRIPMLDETAWWAPEID